MTLKTDETPEQVADFMKTYFRAIDPKLDTWLHVAGYHVSGDGEPQSEVWMVHVLGDTKQRESLAR